LDACTNSRFDLTSTVLNIRRYRSIVFGQILAEEIARHSL
jgi:hypothetical protein